ncbi:MAG: HD domain-containing protein [Saprospiraceae bacterium]|nr:HD domain-containing protein [Saprospiraceae bacterium]
MNKNKIFNDPVYGFVSIHYEILYDLIQHPYFQRLRRITQLGMTHLTYPGAVHTRFHHALGALHLMNLSLEVLRQKGAEITNEEAEAASIAILLHDIGHGPFSHALEGRLIGVPHESISARLLDLLNDQFAGRLSMGIAIFKNNYPKKFLHQLISGQLDLDRMDYLNRDSFYTGVMEGKIGYDRIIKMLRVENGQLVVEAKGIASIEKFLVARKIMYWQVYLHKTVLAAEIMLISAIDRAKLLFSGGDLDALTQPLATLFSHQWSNPGSQYDILNAFVNLDDVDIMILLKDALHSKDYILRTLAEGLINRQLFKVQLSSIPYDTGRVTQIIRQLAASLDLDEAVSKSLVFTGEEQVEIYNPQRDQIRIFQKDGRTLDLSQMEEFDYFRQSNTKYYLCHPALE